MDQEENGGIDLSKKIEESEHDLNQQETQATPTYAPGASRLIRLVIKFSGGLIKDEKQAKYAILGFIGVAIIISIFLVSSMGTDIEEKNIFDPSAPVLDEDEF